MDWSAVAMLVAERSGVPGVLLGTDGTIRLITPSASRTLGWSFDYLGRSWFDQCVPVELCDEARFLLRRAAQGAMRRFELKVLTADGTALATFESFPVGAGDDRGVLLVLEDAVRIPRREPSADYDYEVRGATLELRALWTLGQPRELVRGRCHEVLHGRSTRCTACPIDQAGAPTRLLVRSCVDDAQYELSTASVSSSDEVRISVRRLPAASLAAILDARLEELAARGSLTERERAVLKLLVEGAAIEEIAAALGISGRTVKFHQANLLQKLGADSRSDLMRLVL